MDANVDLVETNKWFSNRLEKQVLREGELTKNHLDFWLRASNIVRLALSHLWLGCFSRFFSPQLPLLESFMPWYSLAFSKSLVQRAFQRNLSEGGKYAWRFVGWTRLASTPFTVASCWFSTQLEAHVLWKINFSLLLTEKMHLTGQTSFETSFHKAERSWSCLQVGLHHPRTGFL